MFLFRRAKLQISIFVVKGAIAVDARKITAWLIALVFVASLGTGCGAINKLMGKSSNKGQQGRQAQKKQTIGVILSPNQEGAAQIKKGLQDAAKREDVKLEFLEDQGGQKEGEKDQQQEGQKDQQQKGGKDFTALIIQGGGAQQSPDILKEAAKKKIPVVAIDQAPESKVDGLVGPDYFRVGELQGDFVRSKLKEGNVVLLQSGEPSAEEVVSGSKTSLAQNPNLKIAQTFASPTKNASPTAAFDDYLKKNPSGVQAVVATDSRLAMEAIEVLKKNNLNKKVLVVGAGTDKKAVDQIASGDLHADVDKSPYLMGLYAYKMASQLGRKQTGDADKTVVTPSGEVPAKLVPVQLVRPENLAQFQKVYAQPLPQEGEGEKQGEGGKEKQSSNQGGSQESNSGGSQKAGANAKQGDQQGKGQQAMGGATQVREKIRTETTREMLGPDGKVLGTETEVKEETRTLPAALVEARQKAQQAGKEQGDTGDKQQDKQGDKEKGKEKQNSQDTQE